MTSLSLVPSRLGMKTSTPGPRKLCRRQYKRTSSQLRAVVSRASAPNSASRSVSGTSKCTSSSTCRNLTLGAFGTMGSLGAHSGIDMGLSRGEQSAQSQPRLSCGKTFTCTKRWPACELRLQQHFRSVLMGAPICRAFASSDQVSSFPPRLPACPAPDIKWGIGMTREPLTINVDPCFCGGRLKALIREAF